MNDVRLSLRENQLDTLFNLLNKEIEYFESNDQNPIILMSGSLGAGKTTFIREWLKFCGASDIANSPTFSLHNIYELGNKQIHHFDLYRLKSQDDLIELGFDEVWGKDGISFIEWWPIANQLIPLLGRIFIEIELNNPLERTYLLKCGIR